MYPKQPRKIDEDALGSAGVKRVKGKKKEICHKTEWICIITKKQRETKESGKEAYDENSSIQLS